jgi:hypothetical protein
MTELRATHAEALKRAEYVARTKIAELESQQTEVRHSAVRTAKAEWRAKLEKERREHAAALSNLQSKLENEIQGYLRAKRQSTSEANQAALLRANEQLKILQKKTKQLEHELSESKKALAKREQSIEDQRKTLEEQVEEITSLKAMVKDSYR